MNLLSNRLMMNMPVLSCSEIPKNGLIVHNDFKNGSYANNQKDSPIKGLEPFNMTTNQDAFIGSNVIFNGINSNMKMINNPKLNNHAFAFWIKPDSGASTSGILISNRTHAVSYQWQIVINYQSRCIEVQSTLYPVQFWAVNLKGKTALKINAWAHVAITYDGNLLSIYINGILDSSLIVKGLIIPTDYLIFGSFSKSDANGTYPYKGNMAELVIYDRAITQEEIKQIYELKE